MLIYILIVFSLMCLIDLFRTIYWVKEMIDHDGALFAEALVNLIWRGFTLIVKVLGLIFTILLL